MAVPPAYGLGVLWGDYDNDGDPDIYVANDSVANFLFQNQGDGKFREIGVLAGVAYNEDGQAQAGMGVAMGDYDHDGFFDFFVTNFSDDYNTLYRNLGEGSFPRCQLCRGNRIAQLASVGMGHGASSILTTTAGRTCLWPMDMSIRRLTATRST